MKPIDSVKVQISAVLGTVRMPINQLLRMGRGAVIALDSTETDPIEIRANNLTVAHGEITIQNEKIAVTVNETLKAAARRALPVRTLVSD